MNTTKKLFCILSMAAFIFQSCLVIYVSEDKNSASKSENLKTKMVKGDKNIVEKKFTLSDYSEIYSSIPGEIVYRQMPAETPYLQITADENILPLIEIAADKNYLKIKSKQNIRPSQLTVYTNSSHLNKVEVTGSGKVYLKESVQSDDMNILVTGSGEVISDDLSCKKIRLAVTGSGNIELTGSGDEASCSITGSGDVDLSGYPVRDVNCKVSGSGDVTVYAKEKLTVEVAGSGSIKYKGNPSEINRRINGSGSIKQIK
jgi:hypothetical protein